MAGRTSTTPADKDATSTQPATPAEANPQLVSSSTEGTPAGDTAAPAPDPQEGTAAPAPATVPTKRYGGDAWQPGKIAGGTVYRSFDPATGLEGATTDTLEPGTGGYVVVAKGDTITQAAHRDLTR